MPELSTDLIGLIGLLGLLVLVVLLIHGGPLSGLTDSSPEVDPVAPPEVHDEAGPP